LSSWSWKVEHVGVSRADVVLLAALESGAGTWSGPPVSVSRSALKRLFEDGAVLCEGAPLRASGKLKADAGVEIRFPEPEPSSIEPEARELEVLFEDEHLLVLNKPPGLTVHPSPTQARGTLVAALLHRGGPLSSVGGPMRPGIVHRLDRDTSGALVVSRTDEAHRALVETFSKHDIERTYWALCYGSPSSRDGKIEGTLGRNPADRKKMAMNVKGGRRALTHYARREEYGTSSAKPFASWLELKLHTGRTHQIRVHLTSLGNSVLGDPVYGVPTERQTKWLALPEDVRAAVDALPGQALHARTLGFTHPITGLALEFTAEPPPAFLALQKVLRKYA
jgi:23S rRNA pseudouridine1911/1915/1917 synthase